MYILYAIQTAKIVFVGLIHVFVCATDGSDVVRSRSVSRTAFLTGFG